MSNEAEIERKSINKATIRVLQVMTEFVGLSKPLGVSELSRRLGMSRNMVHRALVTLHDEGLLYKNYDTGRYTLSYNLATLQSAARPVPDIRTIAAPYLQQIVDLVGETVQLTLRSGDYQSVIDGIEGPGDVVVRVKLGYVFPLHVSVGSRAVLAACDDEDIEDYLARNTPLPAFTETSITEPAALLAEIEAIRKRGFARSFGDHNPATGGFAFALPDMDDRPHGALVVGGPLQRISDAWIEAATDKVMPVIDELRMITALYEAN